MPRDARRDGYSRRHRFSVQGSFGTVLRGSRKLRGRFAIVHVAPGLAGQSRLGVALTRRLVPNAVDRNRVKRLVRDTFRRHGVKHAGLDCVVSLRERYHAANAAPVLEEIRTFFDQLAKNIPR
jgi:ribonuclease P protein component